jgi:hypothetical protein
MNACMHPMDAIVVAWTLKKTGLWYRVALILHLIMNLARILGLFKAETPRKVYSSVSMDVFGSRIKVSIRVS